MEKIVTRNSRFYKFDVVENYNAGIELKGHEVKSIKNSRCSIDGAFCLIKNLEAFIVNMYVSPYMQKNVDPLRTRKLLLKKSEIKRIAGLVTLKKYAVIPEYVYVNEKGLIKIKICVVKHKKWADRREELKRKAIKREIERDIKGKLSI